MWYQERVTFRVGATSSSTPSVSPASAARAQRDRAMKQSVSSGMCGPCCSVVPIGINTASTPRSIACSTSGQVMRSMNRSVTGPIFDECQTSCNTRPSPSSREDAMEGRAQVNGVELWYQVTGEGEPVVQIHGAGFGHFNFAPATPAIAEQFR